jgi:4'-phosphopantetheinyl transferase
MPISLIPYQELHINEEELHLLIFDVNDSVHLVDNVYKLLANVERDKASKYHFKKDYAIFVFTRYLIRQYLARYLGVSADQLSFAYNAFGKPSLPPEINSIGINFSISHSGSLIVIAFSRADNIGVDIELIQEIKIDDLKNQGLLSKNEVSYLETLDDLKSQYAFYKIWTAKEAVSKAIGMGLSMNYSMMETREDFSFLKLRNSAGDEMKYFLRNIETLPDNFIGSLASRVAITQLKYL